MTKSKISEWLKKRKWDILFFGILGLIVFVPQVRMPVMSTVQRVLARTPKELAPEQQKSIQTFDWVLTDLDNKITNLSESRGKVTLINLWATWCPPCVAEMPSLQKLYDHYGEQLDYYFVSHEDPETVARFMKSKNYTFPVYLPVNTPPAQFHSNSLPTTYVIDKNEKIVMKEVGAHNWFSESFRKKIDELLKK
ncbi:MAG TPA: TlpA disulfide reductase family protein [Brumimicrobium sp.]|nr:TlpA disulfide reductase family protein [Brumimicrobium sp.]